MRARPKQDAIASLSTDLIMLETTIKRFKSREAKQAIMNLRKVLNGAIRSF